MPHHLHTIDAASAAAELQRAAGFARSLSGCLDRIRERSSPRIRAEIEALHVSPNLERELEALADEAASGAEEG